MTLGDLIPSVLVSALGCPESLAMDHLAMAGRVLCKDTAIWTVELPVFNTVPNVAAYDLVLPQKTELVSVQRLDVGLDVAELIEIQLRPHQSASGGRPVAWVTADKKLIIHPEPTRAEPVRVIAALTPNFGVLDALPSWLIEPNVEALIDGAKSSLLELLGVDWTNPVMAEAYAKRFRGAISTVSIHRSLGKKAKRQPYF